jgi:transketolase
VRPRAARRGGVAVKNSPQFWTDLELAYRTLCAALFNFAPTSGHPGGSLSSGPIALALAFETMEYDLGRPDLPEADMLCYAAGHKALGLYALLALRDELASMGAADLLPGAEGRMRLEDLLGFRRNPTHAAPYFKTLKARALDGHPTPAVPFVPTATGASGVGLGAAVGLALGGADIYGADAPRVHVVEGEGGLTPGRAHEALSAASTLGLENLIVHLDWNQASIDSDRVCGADGKPGDYVPWEPRDLFKLHGWNVVWAGDGHSFSRVLAAQREAIGMRNGRPTAVVYRTVKGKGYGMEGRASHGAGHAYCSDGYYAAVRSFEERFGATLPRACGSDGEAREKAFYDTLLVVRRALAANSALSAEAARRLAHSRKALELRKRRARSDAPRAAAIFDALDTEAVPEPLRIPPGTSATSRGALGEALGHLNRLSGGALMGSAADLLGSTSVLALNAGFAAGFHHCGRNAGSRLIAAGGICEDAMGAIMSGLSSYGRHVGVTSSYSAFIAPLEHVAARLHVIGQEARRHRTGESARTWIMINAHAGPMTGEDGPTHADVQGLQLLQGNFPAGTLITLTPWEAQEVWPLLAAGLRARPAVLAPFVTRPAVPVPDRRLLGLPAASAAAQGVYALRRAPGAATVVLQGASVTTVFVRDVLPLLDAEGLTLNVYYVASAELFDALPHERREAILPSRLLRSTMAITDFTLPTAQRWLHSAEGAAASLHPFRNGAYLSSGSWESLLVEGGLDGPPQFEAVRAWRRVIDGAK